MTYLGMRTTMFILAVGSSFFPSSALDFGRHTLDLTFFLCCMCLSASSCCSSWRRCWTLLFWDLVKPSGHHCGLGFLYVWLDFSPSSCRVRPLGTWYLH
jgi:hypothetical protein